jgi:hypothetical protein
MLGKLAALAITTASMIVPSAIAVSAGRACFTQRISHSVAGIAAGLIGTLLSPYIGLYAACYLTGDCP